MEGGRGNLRIQQPFPVLAEHGVVITNVQPQGPAPKSGLKQGDVIMAIHGSPIKDSAELVAKIASLPVGVKATIRHLRDRPEQESTLLIGDRGTMMAGLAGSDENAGPNTQDATNAKFGIAVQKVTPAMPRQLGLEGPKGVLVADVKDSSFAEDVGLRRGDVIVEINHQSVHTVDDMVRIQKDWKSNSDVVFRIERSQNGRAASFYLAGTLS